ncbi:MAG: L-lactate permease [Chloroflexi bacterium]|nr:L-lactate permease [Chloroflexota bacterium]
MDYFLAALPILIVLTLMLLFRWGGQRAGPAGWLGGLIIATFVFGLTPDVFWVSQLKGLFLSIFVLAVMIPALFLYYTVDQIGGIRAIALALEQTIYDRGTLLIVLAWAFSGMLEGLAGFGLPIAIVAPMLVGLHVEPVIAVAAVAVGHAWSVTFGDMGIIWQTLIAVVKMDSALLAPTAAIMLGIACLLCGLATAKILGHFNRALLVVALAILMATVQYALAVLGVTPLAAFGAGVAGIVGGILSSKNVRRTLEVRRTSTLIASLASYGSLAILMSIIFLIQPLRARLDSVVWQMTFPEVKTATGFVTPAGLGQAFRFLTHPGTSILLIALVSHFVYTRIGLSAPEAWRMALRATWRSAAPASIGIIAMVGLATLMEHSGMTLLLARAMSGAMGVAFPIASPLVGILGAFATGSNNNSNVLFGSLQKDAALLLAIAPSLLIAAQTTGGSLGSMIAPAKIIVGCSTVGLKGQDGRVLRITLPYGLLIGLSIGLIAFLFSKL